jgi:hypothetical protein
MADTLETAHDFGFGIHGQKIEQPAQLKTSAVSPGVGFDEFFRDWINLSVAHNALNRSMGLPDAYPFALSKAAEEKLRFVHEVIAHSSA